MEFLAIMAAGTVLAILVVIGNRPKQPRFMTKSVSPSRQFSPGATPEWKKEIAESLPMGEMEYLEGIERYEADPQHQPFPLPPSRHGKA
jgi:hypothetical protein